MKTHPITESCRSNLERRNHVCFGISPFNSYFSEQRIRELALWGRAEFESMHFFVPDVPSAYTLEALGYDPEKAAWKARRQCQYLHNKISKALASIGLSHSEASSMVLGWDTLSTNSRYQDLLAEVTRLYQSDPAFQEGCLEGSRWVLERRVPEGQALTSEMLNSAVRYLLSEIPLFLDTASIVGRSSSVFCYHQCVEFISGIYTGKHPIRASEAQGFVVIESQSSMVEPGSFHQDHATHHIHPAREANLSLVELSQSKRDLLIER